MTQPNYVIVNVVEGELGLVSASAISSIGFVYEWCEVFCDSQALLKGPVDTFFRPKDWRFYAEIGTKIEILWERVSVLVENWF